MTTPINPTVDPSSPPVASTAPGSAGMDDEIRQLAAALGVHKQEALSARKAVIDTVALGNGSTPPTVTVELGGVLIPDIRIAASYTPQVGDTVVLLKQANEYFAAFKIADRGTAVANSNDGGFITASLNSGHSHTSSHGELQYRRVLDNGAWKMQWQGGINLGGNDTIVSGLPSDFRPKVRRAHACARDTVDTATCRIDFHTDGSVEIIGPTVSPGSGTTGSGGGWSSSTGSASTASTVSHNHGGQVATSTITHNDGSHSHSYSVGSHSHSFFVGTARPTFVSFSGVEYFL